MAKKIYHCVECGAAVYLTMRYCDQCGSTLYLKPNRFVCNLAVVTKETENLPIEDRVYTLQYEVPFNNMEKLLADRHRYDSSDRSRQDAVIYGKHLLYIWYRLNSQKDGLLRVADACRYELAGYQWRGLSIKPYYRFVAVRDLPLFIKITN